MKKQSTRRGLTQWGCALALLSAWPALAAPEVFKVDSDHTVPTFEVSHFGISTVRGLFRKTGGRIMIDRAAQSGDIEIEIETASVTTNLERRDKLIREWFKSDQFPTLVYRSKQLRFSGENLVAADGELTFIGVTRPVQLSISAFRCIVHPTNKRTLCGADGTAVIKRSDFAMAGGSSVGDEVRIVFNIEGIRE